MENNLSHLEAILLGIVQGLTEFLPVSSSGHLELGKMLLGDTSLPEESMMFTIVLHLATALSTLVVFRRDVAEITRGLFQRITSPEWQFSLKILLSMVPAALIGVLFSEELETLFDQQILLVGAMLWLTGLLLLIADRAKKHGPRRHLWQRIDCWRRPSDCHFTGHIKIRGNDFDLGDSGYRSHSGGPIFVFNGCTTHSWQSCQRLN